MTTSFTDDEILEGLKWWTTHDTPSMGAAEFSERMAWTLARLMVERDQARADRASWESRAMDLEARLLVQIKDRDAEHAKREGGEHG